MSKYTIKQIFIDHWNDFVQTYPKLNIRPIVFEEVEKMLNCGNPKLGYATYYCEHCDKVLHVPFRCKSRFCNTCGVNYAMDRAFAISKKIIRCKHRHMVFTIPKQLRVYFLEDRTLLNGLFHATSSTILSWFHERNKSQKYTPGFMCTLHTFGRDLKWNPHIHVLCSEGGAGNTDVFRKFNYISFSALRFRMQKLLLDYLSNHLPDSKLPKFKKLKNFLYSNYENGFYVYAKPDNISSIKLAVDYVVRYTGRPAMANSRIINYDGEFVTFYYERHEDDKRALETVHVFDFIKKLIIHIPGKGFKMVRYYGMYAKTHKFSKLIFKMLTDIQIQIRQTLRKWRLSIELSFGYDPLRCSCGNFMEFWDIFIPAKSSIATTGPPVVYCRWRSDYEEK